MAKSNYTFERGEAIDVGTHGDTSFVYHSGDPVPNSGDSTVVFEAGVGIGGQAVLEDFENWPDDKSLYNGDTGQAVTTTDTVNEGSTAMYLQDPGSTGKNAIYKPGDLTTTGETYRCDVLMKNGENTEVQFLVQDNGDCYNCGITGGQAELEINKFDFSTRSNNLISNTGINLADNTWYTLEFGKQEDGTVFAEILGNGSSTSTTDGSYTSGGIGFNRGGVGGNQAHYDFYRRV